MDLRWREGKGGRVSTSGSARSTHHAVRHERTRGTLRKIQNEIKNPPSSSAGFFSPRARTTPERTYSQRRGSESRRDGRAGGFPGSEAKQKTKRNRVAHETPDRKNIFPKIERKCPIGGPRAGLSVAPVPESRGVCKDTLPKLN